MQPRMRTSQPLWWKNIGNQSVVLGNRFGYPQLDWRKIEQDLAAMMRKARSMKKKGNEC